jgi:hypothetical protein
MGLFSLLFHTGRNGVVGWCVLGERTFKVLRAELGWKRYAGRIAAGILLAGFGGCSIEAPEYWTPEDPGPTDEEPYEDPTLPQPITRADAGGDEEVDAGTGPSEEPSDIVRVCVEGATRSCGQSAVGMCELGERICRDGDWSDCEGAVMPGARDCSSPLDNDCDGFPDNTLDGVCRCTPGESEPCDTHPGFDEHLPCRAGERTCVLASDNQSSDWGECLGAVAPVPEDSCTIKGDDSDCDGRPNGNCTCIEGEQAECGPPQTAGICRKGKMTCVNGRYGDCMDAVYPKPRDCRSTLDNDCNGLPDNTIDGACTCTVGLVQACNTHPGLDGIGVCSAGSQICEIGANNNYRVSQFSLCVGGNGPSPRNCNSPLDNDCNGVLDNVIDTVCQCVIGTPLACGTHPGLDGFGICRAGTTTCVGANNNSASAPGVCTGSVGPLPADSCTVVGDDSNCNQVVNDTCECVVSANCSSPAEARCSGGACVACSTNQDCAHFPGLGVCSVGICVQCMTGSTAACTTGQVCDDATKTCVAVPPPPPPPVEPPAPI